MVAVAEPPAAAGTVVTAERVVLPLADGGVSVECVIMVETLSVTGLLAEAAPLPLLPPAAGVAVSHGPRSEEHTSELQSLMRISYAVFCLKKKTKIYSDTLTSYILITLLSTSLILSSTTHITLLFS